MTGWAAVTPNPDVLFSDLGEGGILFDLNTKRYFSLNPSAAWAWCYLENGGDLAQLEQQLETAFPGASGLRDLVDYLRREELVEAGAASGEPGAEPLPAAWETPRIEPHGNPLADVILSPFDPTVPIPE